MFEPTPCWRLSNYMLSIVGDAWMEWVFADWYWLSKFELRPGDLRTRRSKLFFRSNLADSS